MWTTLSLWSRTWRSNRNDTRERALHPCPSVYCVVEKILTTDLTGGHAFFRCRSRGEREGWSVNALGLS